MRKPLSKKPDIIAMIPARMGSRRLPMKNLALLNGKPLIYYAVKAARDAKVFRRIVINSEDPVFSEIARRYKVEFYRRKPGLATSRAKSDSVVYDFMKHNPCDILVWVNPTSPLQEGREIREAVKFFAKNKFDSLITVKNEPVHCIYRDRPVNFEIREKFSRTQDLAPVKAFVYSIMIWRKDSFMRAFEKKGHAILSGKRAFYTASKLSSVIIKKKEDLMLAEALLKRALMKKTYNVKYDRIIKA